MIWRQYLGNFWFKGSRVCTCTCACVSEFEWSGNPCKGLQHKVYETVMLHLVSQDFQPAYNLLPVHYKCAGMAC